MMAGGITRDCGGNQGHDTTRMTSSSAGVLRSWSFSVTARSKAAVRLLRTATNSAAKSPRSSPISRSAVKRTLRPLARTDRDPSPANERLFRGIENSYSVALRKLGDDTRRFDHFERF